MKYIRKSVQHVHRCWEICCFWEFYKIFKIFKNSKLKKMQLKELKNSKLKMVPAKRFHKTV